MDNRMRALSGRKLSWKFFFVTSIVAALQGGPAWAANVNAPFKLTNSYMLGGMDRWDYLGIDPVRHHLFISRNTHVQVIDTVTGKEIGEIPHTAGVHGFAFVQDRKRGFITSGQANTVTVFDLDTLKVIATVPAGGNDPDAIAYSPKLRRIYTSNGDSNSVSAIDADTLKLVATIGIGGKPEALVADERGRIFVNIEDKSQIVALDGATNTLLARWPLAPCVEPSGLAMDTRSDRLFTVCSNHRMVVLNASSGHVVAALPIGGHPDAAAFDPQLNMAFSSNGGDGTLTVVHEDDANDYHVAQNVHTQNGARTMVLDNNAQKIFLVSAKLAPAKVAAKDALRSRPAIIPATFNVMVVQPITKQELSRR
jgi:YVTN family beta-propeller protein